MSDNEKPLPELNAWDVKSMAPALTEREKELRDKFVNEFIVDYNQKLAAIRCGFASAFAEDYARKFMSEPYVHQRIIEVEKEQGIVSDDDRDKNMVRAVLKREMQIGSAASRVAAANSFAKILGMEAPTKVDTTITTKSAVQFYLPHNGRNALPEGTNVVTEQVVATEPVTVPVVH